MERDTDRDADRAAIAEKIRTIEELCGGLVTDSSEEHAVLTILAAAAAAELDAILAGLPLRALIAAIDDHPFGAHNRAAFLDLVCEQRLADLSIATRAALIDALQRGYTGAEKERAIIKIFRGTLGAELSDLKNLIDSGADYHDLQQLFYHDIDDGFLREEVLDHIRAQAAPCGHFKVLSDIDDTFYCNWIDARYPKKTIYPGVRAFYGELDLAPAGGGRLGDLTFLTARPGDVLGLVETLTLHGMAERGLPHAKVLTGDVSHLLGNDRIAEKKYAGFIEYRHLFPEYEFVFLGDSGQGDAIAGKRMMEHPDGRMRAVFIHDVVHTPADERATWRAADVYFNDTYVGAAVDACILGLIDHDALARVVSAAIDEFRAICFADPGEHAARRAEIERDLERARALLPPGSRLDPG